MREVVIASSVRTPVGRAFKGTLRATRPDELAAVQASATAGKALAYLASRCRQATWGTTQATIMALRALLLATEKGGADVRGTVEITLNGKSVEKLTLTEANNDLLHQFVGVEIEVPTLEGPHRLSVPEGIQSGTELRVKGKGVPEVQGRGRGDLVVHVVVKTPGKLTREQRKLFEQLSETLPVNNEPHEKGLLEKVKDYFS